jgi:uncharacterized protein (TIGR00297 family)
LPEASGLSGAELRRKVVHMAVGGFAFLLRELTWPQAAALALAAFLFNWQVLPRIGGRGLWRSEEAGRGYARGILLYPLSVLALVLVFHDALWKAAAVWAILAFGDGMASVVGLWRGGRRLPWNEGKSWNGFLAFLVFGTLGALGLTAWTLRLSGAALSPGLLAGLAAVVLFCALVESLPTTLDDNVTVPLAGAAGLWLLAEARTGTLLADPDAPHRLLVGLAVNVAVGALAFFARSIDLAGALSAVLIGTAITLGLGLAGFALMAAFFVIGSVVTRVGYSVKAARGIAQERGGARGWRNAWANGGVAAVLALLAGMSEGPARLLYAVAYAAAVATAAADTCSSEVGKAYGRRTVLITTLRPVPPGTEGAVSLEGTLAALLGAVLVACVGRAGGLYSWPLAALVASAGLLGSLAESVIGTVAERRGWMGNDALNALNTALGAAFAVAMLRIAT